MTNAKYEEAARLMRSARSAGRRYKAALEQAVAALDRAADAIAEADAARRAARKTWNCARNYYDRADRAASDMRTDLKGLAGNARAMLSRCGLPACPATAYDMTMDEWPHAARPGAKPTEKDYIDE